MARMLPPHCSRDCRSPGEREIFHRLQEDPATADWTVLHSLDVARDHRRIAGEIDFVCIVPEKGVLCLEIKACHELHRIEGAWYYGQVNATSPDLRGPFRQAADGMHAARKYIASKAAALAGVPFWSAVIFPYVRFDVESEEWHPWQVIDSRLLRLRPLRQLVVSIMDKARDHLSVPGRALWFQPGNREPSRRQSELIADLLRPQFEFLQSPRERIEQLDETVKRFTRDQLSALDVMEANARILFEGPAGTGKTVLAVEAARRATLAGRSVLVLCFNRLLSKALSLELGSLAPRVHVSTLHHLLLQAAGLAPPSNAGDTFWRDELPLAALEHMLMDESKLATYDELVIDEAQDVVRPAYLDCLDLLLRGGLGAGRWRLFGDFERQAIFEQDAKQAREALTCRCPLGMARYSLRENCRNTPRIAEFAQLIGGMSPGYSRVLRPDDGVTPSLLYYGSKQDETAILADAIDSLRAEGFALGELVVLSPRVRGAAEDLKLRPQWRERLCLYGDDRVAGVRFTTIQAFKGLESPAVIVSDVESLGDATSQALLYVAITRALHRLVVLADERIRDLARTVVSAQLERMAQDVT